MKHYISSLFFGMLGAGAVIGGQHYLSAPQGSETVEAQLPAPHIVNTHFTQAAKFNFNENSFVEASEKTVNAVVHVKNMTIAREAMSIYDLLYGNVPEQGKERLAGTGSGVIISPDGYIVTNRHVIANASSIQVTLNDNKTYKAEVIGADASSDIALLKIKSEEKLPYLTFADSDNTRVGEWVLAIGNPFNLTSTVTAGIISAKARNLSGNYNGQVDSYIQTDAAVNSGNSGGALVNLNGDLIGINTAIASANTGTFVGYSFAVPSNIAKKVVEDLIEYGNVQKGILGVRGAELNSEVAKELNISQTEGFYVNAVDPNSGADKAGIQKGDVITKMDNLRIRKFSDLSGHISTKRPGDKVQVTLIRNGKQKELTVTLQKNINLTLSSLGMVVQELSDADKKAFKTQNGVKIVEASSFYQSRGIEMVGKVLLSVNNQPIKDMESLKEIVSQLNPNTRNSIVVLSKNGEKERFFF